MTQICSLVRSRSEIYWRVAATVGRRPVEIFTRSYLANNIRQHHCSQPNNGGRTQILWGRYMYLTVALSHICVNGWLGVILCDWRRLCFQLAASGFGCAKRSNSAFCVTNINIDSLLSIRVCIGITTRFDDDLKILPCCRILFIHAPRASSCSAKRKSTA